VIRWAFRFEWLDGTITRIEELAYQRWEEERIAEETFFYDPAQLVREPRRRSFQSTYSSCCRGGRARTDRGAAHDLSDVQRRHSSLRCAHRVLGFVRRYAAFSCAFPRSRRRRSGRRSPNANTRHRFRSRCWRFTRLRSWHCTSELQTRPFEPRALVRGPARRERRLDRARYHARFLALAYLRSWRLRAKIATGTPADDGRTLPFSPASDLHGVEPFWRSEPRSGYPPPRCGRPSSSSSSGGDVRARAEEAVLARAFGAAYTNYCARTKRFIPGVY
jgi:hypothetical protein